MGTTSGGHIHKQKLLETTTCNSISTIIILEFQISNASHMCTYMYRLVVVVNVQ